MRCCTPTIFNSLRHVTFTSGTLTFPLCARCFVRVCPRPLRPSCPVPSSLGRASPASSLALASRRPRSPAFNPSPLPFPVPRAAPRTPRRRPLPGPARRRPNRFVPAPPACRVLSPSSPACSPAPARRLRPSGQMAVGPNPNRVGPLAKPAQLLIVYSFHQQSNSFL